MPVVLLCHFDGTNGQTSFTDSSPLAHTLTINGSVSVTTTSPKFGTGSADLSPFACWIDTGNVTDFRLGAGQFTVETWAYFTAAPGLVAMVSQWDNGPSNGWWFGMNSAVLTFFYSTTGSDAIALTSPFTPTLNTWYHLAVDRDGSNTLRIYINGAVANSAAAAATVFASTRNCRIGNDYQGGRNFSGHLDEMRVTTGLAQYAGAFTPPTGPFGGVVAGVAQALAMVLA